MKEIWNWLTGPDSGRNSAEVVPSVVDQGRARNAGWRDVFRLVELLEKHGAEYVLVGGYALSFNGLTRQTGDVDILVPTTPENNRRWISALSELPDGAAKELFESADDPFTVRDAAGPSGPGVIRVIDEFVVDVLPTACGLTYDDLKPHVRRTSTQWGAINVLDLEGLRLTKQSPRGKDRIDLQHIEAAYWPSGDGCPSALRPGATSLPRLPRRTTASNSRSSSLPLLLRMAKPVFWRKRSSRGRRRAG